ncbi:WhiB family transcriptional regulator [Janibacter terrae]|uniref:WhiB family transcriptional regulator n=1 Tax=Janibacter terrae TaxID=103817 RepID=UPI0009ED6049
MSLRWKGFDMILNDRPREVRLTLATLNTHGACAGHPHPDWWFPERGYDDAVKALLVCASCPVREICREYGQVPGGGVAACSPSLGVRRSVLAGCGLRSRGWCR